MEYTDFTEKSFLTMRSTMQARLFPLGTSCYHFWMLCFSHIDGDWRSSSSALVGMRCTVCSRTCVWDREPEVPQMQLSSCWKLLWCWSSHLRTTAGLCFLIFLKETKVYSFTGILQGFTLKYTLMVNQLFHYGVLRLFGWLQTHKLTQMLYIEYFCGIFCVWLIWVMVSIQKE